MAIEIERRFLVRGDPWRAGVLRTSRIRQAFLTRTPDTHIRVRRLDDLATLTVKGPRKGFRREEFEYPIPRADAEHMLRHRCVTPVVTKLRHWVEHAGMIWEIDIYRGASAGLVLAEVELTRADQAFERPPWIGAEVTDDLRYRSAGIEMGLWRLVEAGDLPGEPPAPHRRGRAAGLVPDPAASAR